MRLFLTLSAAGLALLASVLVNAQPQPERAASATRIAPHELAQLLLLDVARAGQRLVAVGERGTIIVSGDAGKRWQRVASASEATLTGLYFVDANNGWAVGHDATILHSGDGGASWQVQRVDLKALGPLLDVRFKNTRQGFAVGAYGTMLQTQDGGVTWQSRRLPDEDRHLNAIVGGADARLYVAGEAGLLYVSEDDGEHWRALSTPYRGSFFGILRMPHDGLLVFGLRGNIFRSTDGGASWQAAQNVSMATLSGGTVSADGAVLLTSQDGALLISHDQGARFAMLAPASSKADVAVLPLNATQALVVGEGGVRTIVFGKSP